MRERPPTGLSVQLWGLALIVARNLLQTPFLGMRLGRGTSEPPKRCSGAGSGELLLHGHSASVWGDEHFWE